MAYAPRRRHQSWQDIYEAEDTTSGTRIFRKRRSDDDEDDRSDAVARDGDSVIVPALLMDSASQAGESPELHRPGHRTAEQIQRASGCDLPARSAPVRDSTPRSPQRAAPTFWCRDEASLEAHEQRGRALRDTWMDPGPVWGEAGGLLGPLTGEQLDRLIGAVEQPPAHRQPQPRPPQARTEAAGQALLEQVLRERDAMQRDAWKSPR